MEITVKEAIAELEKRKEFLTAQCDNCWDPAIEMALQALKRQQWIPCSERLPEAGEVVLVYGKRGGIYTAVYNKPEPEWRCGWWKLNSKSHKCMPDAWMPLPPPPEVNHE